MKEEEYSDILCAYRGGVRLTVRVKPGSSRMRALKVVDIGQGKRAVEVSVAADAREGKANKALIERLAKEWGISKKLITIESGETSRLKIVEIADETHELLGKIADYLSDGD